MNPSTPEEPWPVRTVSRLIGDWVNKLGAVWIEGQVTNLTVRGGRAYLSLRDPAADASLSVTVAPAVVASLDAPLTEGQHLVVAAKPGWRMDRGRLTLDASEIRAVGLGALLARLERLRAVLAQEGLFDVSRKKTLPFLPRVVGLICGRESDALHDVVANATRRWPAVVFDVREVPVQGPYAVTSIVDALRDLDRAAEVDVVVIARGGGDVQELLPFSDEALLRAVAACRTPVVSAIGHEAHTPLLDLVADVRASTPTDAGKRVVPDVAEEHERIRGLRRRAWRCADALAGRETTWVSGRLDKSRYVMATRLESASRDVAAALARVTALSPKATLDRGYAVVQRPDGRVVRSVSDADEALTVRLADGVLDVTVTGATRAPDSAAR